jgi:hypothetical protein
MLQKFETVAAEIGQDAVYGKFDDEELAVLKEFLQHGQEIRNERERANAQAKRRTLYRWSDHGAAFLWFIAKRIQDSPAYRLNHEEVQKALEEGIDFVECMNPAEAVPDEFNAIKAIIFERLNYVAETGKFENTGEMHEFPARTVCVAAGTSPNVIYEKEKTGHVPARRMAPVFPALSFDEKWRRQLSRGAGRQGRDWILHVVRTRRKVYLLLRRQPSEVRGQRRKGNGFGETRLHKGR